MKIGVLSDTHGILLPQVKQFLSSCHQIWHAGDIGSMEVWEELQAFRPLKAVYGNIDGNDIRNVCPQVSCFEAEGLKILMTHIGGYPPKYNATSKLLLQQYAPDIFVCGHSHILKVIYDQERKILSLNPGAAGTSGFHKAITCLRFDISNKTPQNMEVYHQDRKF